MSNSYLSKHLVKVYTKIKFYYNFFFKYNKNPGLKERLGEKYRVRMGFGLHIGWAIEGAIGSEFKIDASYLSPNVNMSARLEGMTKIYGVPLLLTLKFYNYNDNV